MQIKKVIFELADGEEATVYVEFDHLKATAFREVLRRALNTWDKAPDHVLQLSDLVEDINSRSRG